MHNSSKIVDKVSRKNRRDFWVDKKPVTNENKKFKWSKTGGNQMLWPRRKLKVSMLTRSRDSCEKLYRQE